MSVLIWLCGPSAIGKHTLAEQLRVGVPGALEAFGLDAAPVVIDDVVPAASSLWAMLSRAPVVVAKRQHHRDGIVRAVASLGGDRLHRLALLWCSPEVYAARYAAKYPGLATRPPADLADHWVTTSWVTTMALHAGVVAAGAMCSVELYDVSGSVPLRVRPACAVRFCDCLHVDAEGLVGALAATG